jgi:hypothetical protein
MIWVCFVDPNRRVEVTCRDGYCKTSFRTRLEDTAECNDFIGQVCDRMLIVNRPKKELECVCLAF